MKALVFSDIHLERFHGSVPNFEIPDNIDIGIAAGDLGEESDGVNFLKTLPFPVLYVPGNREYYGQNYQNVVSSLIESAAGSNVSVLEKSSVTISGVEFLGATLWTDLDLFGSGQRPEVMNCVKDKAAPFRYINYGASNKKFTPEDMRQEHSAAKAWLETRLKKSTAEKKIVVTHHLPLKNSLDSRFGGMMDAMFASDLSDIVEGSTLSYWIHGHTHVPKDYSAHGCRIVCSPWSHEDGYRSSDLGVVIDI